MKNIKLLAIIATLTLLIGIFAVIPANAVQPPLIAGTYYLGTIGQPVRIDPARAYDTASGALLQNIYQTLIWWNDTKPINFTAGIGYNLQVSDYADLDQYQPVVATEVPTESNLRLIINDTGSYWRFTIDPLAKFQSWTGFDGVYHAPRAITAADVVWSFRRQVIYDSIYSPDWMFMTPAFGIPSWRYQYGGLYQCWTNGTFKSTADEIAAGDMIKKWCYSIGNDVYFWFQLPWAPGVLKQIFAQTWGGIVNPDWAKEYGAWDGVSLGAGWTNLWRWKPTSTRSELDTWKDPAIYGAAGAKYSYANWTLGASGSGPYFFTSWDTTNKIVRIDYDPAYWKGWTKAGDKLGNYLKTVIWRGIDAWPTRKMLFLEGEFDVCVVPTANMFDLLATTYNPLPGIQLTYNIAALQNDVMLYGFNISTASAYQAYVGYPTHTTAAQPYFFANTFMRRAFSWAFNYTSYVADAWFGEAIVQNSWWVDGLSPAEYKNTNSDMPQRNLDLTKMQNELNQAVFDGRNVGTDGFDMKIVYNLGNDQRLIACNLIAEAFASLNSKYHVEVVGVDWPVFLDAENSGALPMYDVGWLADFADPDNFCEPYQASWGAFMSGQGPPYPADQDLVDQEISDAMVEPDYNIRMDMYKDLQYRYWLDSPSWPLVQPSGRRFARDWVQGWYYNALYPGLYAYDQIYKAITTPLGSADVDATATITPGPGPTYNTALIFGDNVSGNMYMGIWPNGTARLLAPQGMNYSVHIQYAAGAVGNLLVGLALKRNTTYVLPYGETAFPAADQVVLTAGQTYSTVFWWSEVTVDQKVKADNAQEGTAHHGTIYDVGLEAYPVNGLESNTANNWVKYATWNASRLVGDCKSDGIVDIYDALKLSAAFNADPTKTNWNINADIKPDLIVDIYDALLLSANFNKHVP